MSEPKQKAFCRDYDRLAGALSDHETAMAEIPPSSDGGGGDLGPRPDMSASSTMTGYVPGVGFGGWVVEFHVDGNYYVGWAKVANDLGNFGGEIDKVTPVWLLEYGIVLESREQEADFENTLMKRQWLAAIAEVSAMEDAMVACAEWVSHAFTVVGEGADNSEERAKVEAARVKLSELRSAFDESMRKWKEH